MAISLVEADNLMVETLNKIVDLKALYFNA